MTTYGQLSDTSDLKGLIQMCEFLLGFDDAGISGNANLLKHFYRLLNTRYREALGWCFEAAGDWQYRGDNTASISITASTRAYALASNLTNFLRILRVDIKYPSTASDYEKATQIDMQKVSPNGLDNYTPTEPEFDLVGDYLNIYVANKTSEITAVTSGIKVYFDDDITDLATVTTVASIPTLFLDVLAIGASIDYCVRESMDKKLAVLKSQQIEKKAGLLKFIANRSEAKRSSIRSRQENFGQEGGGINFTNVNTN